MKFELYSRLGLFGRRWRWRLRADNGEIIASGQGYHSIFAALKGIGLVKSTDANTPVKEV